jgi:hypothetical protein
MRKYLKKTVGIFFGMVFLLLFNISHSKAENIPQTFTLKPGWNAVFLEVEPHSTDPGDVFAGITDLQSVWRWNPRTSTVQFIQNPDELIREAPQWMVYYPGKPQLTNLYTISGETAYLINMGGTSNVSWTVTGEPAVPDIDWKPNSFNFVGFHLDDQGQEPFFIDFFSTSPAHAGEEIYRLDNATGTWLPVTDPTIPMIRGEAFWVYCNGYSEFTGPLSVQLEQGSGLHYGTVLVEQDLHVLNNSARDKSVYLSVSSADVNLHYWLFDPQGGVAEWVDLASHPQTILIGSGQRESLRLGVLQAGMTAGTTYEANAILIDGEGMKIRLPVTVVGLDYVGLWVGNATILKVSRPQSDDPETPEDESQVCLPPVETGSEFSFRIIVHVDNDRNVRLLREVIELWQEGTWKPDPNDSHLLVPDQPGHFVLIGNDALLPLYSAAALRDGQPVGRRISSAAFGFYNEPCDDCPWDTSPWEMVGDFMPGGDLWCTLVLAPDEPTNPFRHKYHPDHKEPVQSYKITREIDLFFRDEYEGRPITGVPMLSWGSTDVGGIYKEGIYGLNRSKICVEGTFVLHKVNNIAQLLH